MPQCPTTYIHEPAQWLFCLVDGCSQKFCLRGGWTKHLHAKHNDNKLYCKNSPIAPRIWHDTINGGPQWTPLNIGSPDLSHQAMPDLGFLDGNIYHHPFMMMTLRCLTSCCLQLLNWNLKIQMQQIQYLSSNIIHLWMVSPYTFLKPLSPKAISQLYHANEMGHP